MPLLCVQEKRSPTQLDEEVEQIADFTSIWGGIPDSILLQIFSYLDIHHLGCVVQTCKAWNRVGYDESLWRRLLFSQLGVAACPLADGKLSWREEVKRVTYHAPTLLSETLTEHTDEVLHVSFSHDGRLFSTTSKDATLKVWEVGYPTTQRYSKDFHELLEWDFTQFSCFNESDTMVLVSSVKTSTFMDRRGYMAILSLLHDFAILRVVTMDPSQLFGAWLDDRTFLGGSLEISLDRFATTVQIEAFEISDDIPIPTEIPTVEESAGQSLFTFSSESASLIKFLTVATPTAIQQRQMCSKQEVEMGTSLYETEAIPSCTETLAEHCKQEVVMGTSHDETEAVPSCSEVYSEHLTSSQTEHCSNCSHKNHHGCSAAVSGQFEMSSHPCRDMDGEGDSDKSSKISRRKLTEKCKSVMPDVSKSQREKPQRPTSLVTDCDLPESGDLDDDLKMDISGCYLPSEEGTQNRLTSRREKERCPTHKKMDSAKRFSGEVVKNLIFVTGEFAVALHQLGFKNVSAYAKESVLARGVTQMDEDNPDSFMVLNYSNNDVHLVYREQRTDKPDNLIDLFGHVTGQCLSADHRYLFINCRPWIGNIDRTDPWATPDLSPNIEVRVIDLLTMEDVGVRYKGHKGFSPSNMCCFVFLDVSEDYVSSGSEDNKGYLWDRHYQSVLTTYPHNTGVVNAVAFNPKDQETLVTVSDDFIIKVWRSPNRMKSLSGIE